MYAPVTLNLNWCNLYLSGGGPEVSKRQVAVLVMVLLITSLVLQLQYGDMALHHTLVMVLLFVFYSECLS